MNYSEFYTLTNNLPFTVSLTVVTFLCALEGVMLFMGVGIINTIDSLLPDFDMDIEGFGLEDKGLVSQTLSFLRVKRVPIIILLVFFLVSFGLSGLFLQAMIIKITGSSFHYLIVSFPALLIGISMMKAMAEVVSKIIPADETDALSIDYFTNKVGIIILGTAKATQPAQCKIKDHHGKVHYFMIYPDEKETELKQGERVLLVRYEAPYFYGIKPNNKNI